MTIMQVMFMPQTVLPGIPQLGIITSDSSNIYIPVTATDGSTPDSYTAYYRRAGTTGSYTSAGSTTYTGSPMTVTISGLTSNYAYEVYVTATNSWGTSAGSFTDAIVTGGATTAYQLVVVETVPFADPGNLFADWGYDKNSVVDGGDGTEEGTITPTTWATSWTWEAAVQTGATASVVQFRGPTTTQTGLWTRIACGTGQTSSPYYNQSSYSRVLLSSEANSFATGQGSDGSVSTWTFTSEPTVLHMANFIGSPRRAYIGIT